MKISYYIQKAQKLWINSVFYHGMAITDSRYQLLEEKSCLNTPKIVSQESYLQHTNWLVHKIKSYVDKESAKLDYSYLVFAESPGIAYSLEELSSRCVFHYYG